MIIGGSFGEWIEGRLVTSFKGLKKKYAFEKDEIVSYRNYQFDYGYHRFIYHLQFLKDNDIFFPPYIRFQDPPFFVKAMAIAGTFYAVRKVTYCYRVGTQKIVWTEQKLIDLLRGLRDILVITSQYHLKELHCITLQRLGENYADMCAKALPTASPEMISALIDIEKSIDLSLVKDEKLKEYLVKGYNLNVERFKNNGNDPYFDELLDKIRDIRSSEKVFWRKILDIYATSIDYNPKKEITINFFKTIQNKMHYAVSNNTAAEIVYNRVDSTKDNIGLTNFKGDMPTRKETEIAKNYLTYEELQVLNRLVSAYLDIAEINALKRKAMTMQDWINELDSFLKMTHNDILYTKETISHEEALKKAHEEYDKYMQSHLTQVERDYLEIMNFEIKEIDNNN